MSQFSELGLAQPILSALAAEGYTRPTPIQAQAIPVVLGGADLLGIAQTGTGKTAAFALPILHRLASDKRPTPRKGCRVLVLSPTRELASQIAESFRAYGRNLGLSVAVVFGGVSHRPQIDALTRGVDILVATPGRLLDHMAQRVVGVQTTEIFVLDEADQMLDLGFVRPIRQIVSKLPHRRQSLFFSATMPDDIAKLASELLTDPVRVAVAPVGTTVERVSQRVIHVEQSRKSTILTELLADPGMERTIVFTRTKRGADKVARHLEAEGLSAAAIHGNKSQRQREIALEDFRRARTRVLVATDIAARGIDIDAVTHVVNYDLPEVPDAYVHRIGRTARAGASGSAISFCDGEERDLLRAIEKLTRKTIPAEDKRGRGGAHAAPRPSQHRSEPRESRGATGASGEQDRRVAPQQARGHRGHGSGEAGSRHPRSEHRAEYRPENRPDFRSEHRGEGRNGNGQRSDAAPTRQRDHAPRSGAPGHAAGGGHRSGGGRSEGGHSHGGNGGGYGQRRGSHAGRARDARGPGHGGGRGDAARS